MLCCVALCFVVCLVLHRVVIYPLFVSQLVCWLKISQFSCTFIAQLDTTTRRKGNASTSSTSWTTLSNTSILYSPQANTFLFPWRLHKPVEVMSSLTKNSTEKNGQKCFMHKFACMIKSLQRIKYQSSAKERNLILTPI